MRNQKQMARMVGKLLDKMPTWLFLTIAVIVMVLITLVSLSEMGLLPFELPGLGNLADRIDPYGQPAETIEGQIAQVHMIDVGQGDAALILAGDQAVLIDAGEREYGQTVCDYLKAQGVKNLDLVIATHPHSDHIGGLPDVLEQFSVTEILMPNIQDEMIPTTATFERLLDAVEEQDITATAAHPGQQYQLAEQVVLTILGPVAHYDDLNNYSIVCRLDCADRSFLFTGDAEKRAEQDIMDSGAELSADVLIMGHHGSSTSSGEKFLDLVNPRTAGISCGEGNDYGHPHRETMQSLEERWVDVLRTDLHGTVVFSTDGKDISLVTEKDESK